MQALLPGTVTVVVDADDSQPFLQQLAARTSGSQILIGSTGPGQSAAFLLDGEISFSKFFWIQVLNGARVRQAFSLASTAIRFARNGPVAQLDDTGNGIANELSDGLLANRYSIGSGVLLAGDDPLIGAVAPSAFISGTQFLVFVDDVTSTGVISSVDAIASKHDGSVQSLNLVDAGGGRYEAQLSGLDANGFDVEIAVYARDTEGKVSLPAKTRALGAIISRFGFE